MDRTGWALVLAVLSLCVLLPQLPLYSIVCLHQTLALGHSSSQVLGPVGLECVAFCLTPSKAKDSKTPQIKIYFARRKNFRISGRQRKNDVTAACIQPQQRTAVIQSPILTPGSGKGAAPLFVSDGHRHPDPLDPTGCLNCLCSMTLYHLIRILPLDCMPEVYDLIQYKTVRM